MNLEELLKELTVDINKLEKGVKKLLKEATERLDYLNKNNANGKDVDILLK